MIVLKVMFKNGQKEGCRYVVAYDLEDGAVEARQWLERAVFAQDKRIGMRSNQNGIRDIISVEVLNVSSSLIVTKRALGILARDAKKLQGE